MAEDVCKALHEPSVKREVAFHEHGEQLFVICVLKTSVCTCKQVCLVRIYHLVCLFKMSFNKEN